MPRPAPAEQETQDLACQWAVLRLASKLLFTSVEHYRESQADPLLARAAQPLSAEIHSLTQCSSAATKEAKTGQMEHTKKAALRYSVSENADPALKPAAIPIINRPPFRFEAGHHSNQ